eukprot:scaffold134975_cov35-Prasinocladus_malaysianus.AAC.1
MNVVKRLCECGARVPTFGLPGEKSTAARWCSRCPSKSPDAVDVVTSRRCRCGASTPSYGLPGETRASARYGSSLAQPIANPGISIWKSDDGI